MSIPKDDAVARRRYFTAAKETWVDLVAYDSRLGGSAPRVAILIKHHLNFDEGCAWPSISRLASSFDASEKTVRDALHGLRDHGYLLINEGGGRKLSSRYWITFEGEKLYQNIKCLDADELSKAETAAFERAKQELKKRAQKAGGNLQGSSQKKPSEKRPKTLSESARKPVQNLQGKPLKYPSEEPANAQARGGVDFDDFWERWGGDDPADSRVRASREWRRMSVIDCMAAVEAIPRYRADCLKRNRKSCFAATFLRDQVWRGFEAKPVIQPERTEPVRITIFPNTEQAARYRWQLCLDDNRTKICLLDQRMEERRPVEVPEARLSSGEFCWVEVDSDNFRNWRLFHMAHKWPVPPVVSHPDRKGSGYWFPSECPPSTVHGAPFIETAA